MALWLGYLVPELSLIMITAQLVTNRRLAAGQAS